MYQIVRGQLYTLRIDLELLNGRQVYAEYPVLYIQDESDKYAIYYYGYSGNATDQLGRTHRGMKFTTEDSDNDHHARVNCATQEGGAWWFNRCDASNLNGVYGRQNYDGVEWGERVHCRKTSMRIKPAGDVESAVSAILNAC